jgi:hypothetical protein
MWRVVKVLLSELRIGRLCVMMRKEREYFALELRNLMLVNQERDLGVFHWKMSSFHGRAGWTMPQTFSSLGATLRIINMFMTTNGRTALVTYHIHEF